MRERVRVCVDDKESEFYLGAKVRHAVGYQVVKLVNEGKASIQDQHGNEVDLDGALYDGERLYVVREPRK